MKILILFFLLFLISCGKNDFLFSDESPEKKTMDKTFLPYLESYKNYYGTIKTPIIFDDLEENILGVCAKYSNGYTEIKIDRNSWKNFDENKREQLILHELGHCELNRQHKDSFLNNDCPESIMRSYIFSNSEIENCFLPDFNYYMNELKNV